MASETVADIVKRVRRDCNSYPLPTAAAEMLKLVREIEAAHQREVAVVLKDRDEMFKSEQETVAKTKEWFDEYQKLKRKVAELRKRLKVGEDALAKLQERLVSSVHDGTIDPYEALKIAETALAALRVEGGAK